jgi:hypothetical protein
VFETREERYEAERMSVKPNVRRSESIRWRQEMKTGIFCKPKVNKSE